MLSGYDSYLVNKGIVEEMILERALLFGAMERYLCGSRIEYEEYSEFPDWAEPFIEEGRGGLNYTAEELFVMAHERDIQEFGSAIRFFPFPYN